MPSSVVLAAWLGLIVACANGQHDLNAHPEASQSADLPHPAGVSASASPVEEPATRREQTATEPALKPKVALRAARPWSFTATVGPVALGAALAFKIEDVLNVPLFVLTLATTLSVHAAGNLMNTYFDFRRGVDTPTSSDLTLVKGQLLPRQVAKLIGGSYGIAAATAIPLCMLSRAPLHLLASLLATGAASAFVYTGGPGLKYKALGDLLISGTFGPLLVAFTYAVQTGTIGWKPLVASLPITLHIEAILHANNARDVEEDVASGIMTLAARLGEHKSYLFYAVLLALPYLAPIYAASCHSLLAALPLATVPAARKLATDFAGGRFVDLPKRTAKLQFLFAALLVVGSLLPSPSLKSVIRSIFAAFL